MVSQQNSDDLTSVNSFVKVGSRTISMNRKLPKFAQIILLISREIHAFFSFFAFYIKRKFIVFSHWFEKNKNRLVKLFIMKRGRYNRPFLHLTTMIVMIIGVLVAPFLADTFPIFASQAQGLDLNSSANQKESIFVGENVFQTQVSKKPRDRIIIYTVEKGDTLGTIAEKFDVSQDTILWENDLDSDDLSIGQELRILPVSGVAYKVQAGDTIYSIASKYHADSQTIVDFPFNEFANSETFALVVGQMLIVPGGSVTPVTTGPTYINTGSVPVARGGWVWPVVGLITQYASWYHMALDIAGPVGSPVIAAHAGTISYISTGTYDTGYGNNVWINNGDGVMTHYAHLSCVTARIGQQVRAGQQIGCRGNTGRSTGPHTHFEIQVNGSLVNPMRYVSP